MNDFVNGLFESLGGFIVFLSIRRLYYDKEVKGMSPLMLLFFTSWGYWNLYFYPSVGAWLSFWGSVGVTTANTVYLGMVIYYVRHPKPESEPEPGIYKYEIQNHEDNPCKSGVHPDK